MRDTLLWYPFRGPWLERTAVGSVLVLGSVLVVPAVLLVGYCLRVLEGALEGDDEPPAFGEWQTLASLGGWGTAITAVYLFGPLLAGAFVAGILAAIGYLALATVAPFVGGQEAVVLTLSIVAALAAALVALAIASVTLAIYFTLPAALTRYAATKRVRAAFDRDTVTSIVLTREYVIAMATLQLVPLVVPLVVLVCLVTVVGIPALPAVPFLAVLWSAYGLGVALRRGHVRVGPDESTTVESSLPA
ncbi:DUF4013 domain-containing protein [Salinadaptatus halalkaliphilus]|uniref:DUF4013 domain-containing protein n=1 Tax=Salinadaptatus halalkaliphilus TaxID=2419781 RepID=A0A4S3TRX9_9EURY|nr:DUF4013 domain-containing protein [Salinadaptatus halalkaliphilus]THE66105.1 DUF4013 domain-containing protein [Salinadaptatus halalkaliphilus]